ncbi:hypothetical protein [Algibacillus agarilyticus]|uniref:hypothetical protein n=1 Tax=Algibacillus agarilyticus TaxID=2234133 RepID=UPI000DCF671D|nr:hypothetical protein [Algibacillus agarilyticus]
MNQTINAEEKKQRKKRWKEFAKLIDNIGSNNRYHYKYLEQFYLTGEEDAEHPVDSFHGAPLIEMLLSQDQSPDNLLKIKKKYSPHPRWGDGHWVDAKRYYKERMDDWRSQKNQFSNATMLGGGEIEYELFKLFYPQRVEPNEFDKKEEFQVWVEEKCSGLTYELLDFFECKKPSSSFYMKWWLAYWCDCINYGFKEDKVFGWLLEAMLAVQAKPDKYTPLQLELAEKIFAIAEDDSINPEFRKHFANCKAALNK